MIKIIWKPKLPFISTCLSFNGIEARRFRKVATHTLSDCQLAACDNRRIYHGINKARDAVQVASGSKEGMGLLDNDYKAAFDYMVMLWVFKVLLAKGVDPAVIKRLKNIYVNNITTVVINNIPGNSFPNNRCQAGHNLHAGVLDS